MKILLVLWVLLVKVIATMKRKLSLVVLLGLMLGGMLVGCQKEETQMPATTNAPAGTNMTK